jgi:hypothetical protein
VTLEPISAGGWPEVLRLDQLRQWDPNLGGAPSLRNVSTTFGPPMLVRDNRSAIAVGMLENSEMSGYPGVAVVLIFLDKATARPGLAVEAWALYIAHVFACGARLVHHEVFEFNRPVHRMFAKLGLREQVRMRDQVFIAGRFWDVIVYAFDQAEFKEMWRRHARSLPGGGRLAALGGARR